MHFPTINMELLPIKMSFFFLLGGISPFTPFLTTISKQRGYSPLLVGIVFSIMPLFAVAFRPIFCVIADRFRCRKTVALCSIVAMILLTGSYDFIPETTTPADDAAVLATYQFWLFFLFLAARYITHSVITTLTETMCLQNLGENTHLFGQQRLWGCMSWGMCSLLTGWLIDWYSKGKPTKDYTPGLVVSIVFLTAGLLTTFKIKDDQTNVSSKHMFKDLKKVLNDFMVVSYFIYIVFFGIFYASISLYLIWHLEELVTKYHPEKYSSIKTIQGTLIAIKCFAGETPFFFISGKIITKVGHINSIGIGLFTLSVRFFLYFIITNPLWIIPVEILSGLGFALPYSAMTSYAAVIAPESIKGTVQGLVGTVFQGIGVGLGSLITGSLFGKIGSSNTYLVLSMVSLVICVVQTVTTRIMAGKKETENN